MLKEMPVDAFNATSGLSELGNEANANSSLNLRSGQIVLSGPLNDEWELKQPLILEIEVTQQGEVIVSNDALETYGVGSTPQEAIEEFVSMLLDLRQELVESEDRLSVHYRRILQRMRTYLTTF